MTNFNAVDSHSNVVQAIVLAVVWLVVVLGVRFTLRLAFSRYEKRLAEQDAGVAVAVGRCLDEAGRPLRDGDA